MEREGDRGFDGRTRQKTEHEKQRILHGPAGYDNREKNIAAPE